MSRCFRSFVRPLSTPVSKFISNHPSLYLLENKHSNMKALQMLLALVITRGFSGSPNPEIAIDLFVQMLVVVGLSIQLGRLTYPSVFKDGAQLGVAKDGAQLHGRVVKSGLEFDRFIRNTMINMSLLNASANLGALEQGKWIHTYMNMNVTVMYCRCGDIKTAYRVFENPVLGYNGLSCSNTIIVGLANNAFQNEAIQLFSRLMQPVQGYFTIMNTVYNIEPLSQHYGCMIDTSGCAGHLEEAEQLTKQTPMNPDAAICGSRLSAARHHKNIKTAKRVAEKLAQTSAR